MNYYRLIINYVYEDGTEAYATYDKERAYDSNYSIKSPTVVGYTPDIEKVTGKMGLEETEVTVTYMPSTNTKYTVLHYLQNINDDEYSLGTTEVRYGTTKEETKAKINEYEGFTSLEEVEQKIIEPNGSTVIELYYTRNSYELKYVLDGEEFGEIETYKFGEAIELKEPTKIGYKFSGWNENISVMPAEDVVLTGTFVQRNDLSYTVNYYEEGTTNKLADSKIVENQAYDDKVVVEALEIEGYNKPEDARLEITIKEDGNIVNFYYTKRNDLSYTVNYYLSGTTNKIAESLVVENVSFGDEIKTEDSIKLISGYTYSNIDKETIVIGVNENVINVYYDIRQLTSIEITKEPYNTIYTAYDEFNKNGMKVIATYDNGEKEEVTEYEITPNRALEVTDTKITISYEQMTTEQPIRVRAKAGTENPDYPKALEELQKDLVREVTYHEQIILKEIDLGESWEWYDEGKLIYVEGEEVQYFKVVYKSKNMNYEDVYDEQNVVAVRVKKAHPRIIDLGQIKAEEGDTLEDIKDKLPAGFEFMDPLDTSVGNIGNNEFKVRYIPEDTDNYNIIEEIPVTINVVKRYIRVEDITLIEKIKIAKGEKIKLEANISPDNVSNAGVTWTSSNDYIVAVDQEGNIEAKEYGIAYIIARTAEGGKTASCRVEVIEKLYDIEPIGEKVCVTQIAPDTTSKKLIENFPSVYEMKIYNHEGEEIAEETKLGTGYTLKLYNGEELKEELQLIVRGDVTGDGEIDCIDSSNVIYHRLGMKNLEDVYGRAADLNNDGVIDGRDSTKLIYHRLGILGL